jgi:hypothetical protein
MHIYINFAYIYLFKFLYSFYQQQSLFSISKLDSEFLPRKMHFVQSSSVIVLLELI